MRESLGLQKGIKRGKTHGSSYLRVTSTCQAYPSRATGNASGCTGPHHPLVVRGTCRSPTLAVWQHMSSSVCSSNVCRRRSRSAHRMLSTWVAGLARAVTGYPIRVSWARHPENDVLGRTCLLAHAKVLSPRTRDSAHQGIALTRPYASSFGDACSRQQTRAVPSTPPHCPL